MKKVLLSVLPIAAFSVIAFAGPSSYGVTKLADSPLYKVDFENSITDADRSSIVNILQEAYNIEVPRGDMQFAMMQGAKARILFKTKTVKSIDVEEMLIVEEGKGEEQTTSINALSQILLRYE